MLMGHSISLHKENDSSQFLLEDPSSGTDGEENFSDEILYRASFEEHARHYIQYETIIWVFISLPLVLAWGVGLFMLLYLPVRRYVLRKDVYSRELCITPHEIIYKVTRPLFLPFLGWKKIENRIQLHLVTDIIIEQGCLQAGYGIHTFRIESIAYGETTPVSELQIQGVSDPQLLRKVIVSEAAKNIREARAWKPKGYIGNGEYTSIHARSNSDTALKRSLSLPSKRALDAELMTRSDVLLHKLDEVRQSVKKIESLIQRSVPWNDG